MDITYSVRQYLTMYYYTAVNYGYTYASIDKLEGKWIQEDDRVNIWSGELKAQASGDLYEDPLVGGEKFNDTDTFTLAPPNFGTIYVNNVDFPYVSTNYYVGDGITAEMTGVLYTASTQDPEYDGWEVYSVVKFGR